MATKKTISSLLLVAAAIFLALALTVHWIIRDTRKDLLESVNGRLIFTGRLRARDKEQGTWILHMSTRGLITTPVKILEDVFSIFPVSNGTLAYVNYEGTLVISGSEEYQVQLPRGDWSIAGYADIPGILLLTSNGIILHISLEDRKVIRQIETDCYLSNSPVGAGGTMLAGSNNGDIVLVSSRTGRVTGVFDLSGSHPAVSPEGNQIAYFEGKGDIVVCHVNGDSARRVKVIPRPQPGTLKRLEWSPDGRYLACEVARVVNKWLGGEHGDSVIYLIDISSGKTVRLPIIVWSCWSFQTTPGE